MLELEMNSFKTSLKSMVPSKLTKMSPEFLKPGVNDYKIDKSLF